MSELVRSDFVWIPDFVWGVRGRTRSPGKIAKPIIHEEAFVGKQGVKDHSR